MNEIGVEDFENKYVSRFAYDDMLARAEAAEARVAELEAVLKHEEHEKLTVSELDKSTITWLLERLIIATDLGDKRWKALNEIYEQAASGNTDWHWRHRKAGEGLGLKEEVEE